MSEMEQAVTRLESHYWALGAKGESVLSGNAEESHAAVLSLYAVAIRERDEALAELRRAHDERDFARNDAEREKTRAAASRMLLEEKQAQLEIADHMGARAEKERDEARALAVQAGKALTGLVAVQNAPSFSERAIIKEEWASKEVDAALAALRKAKLEV